MELCIPLKVKIFVWLVLKSKILTIDNLHKRSWPGEQDCVLCLDTEETIDHFFAMCEMTRILLECLMSNKKGTLCHTLVYTFWETSRLTGGAIRTCEGTKDNCLHMVGNLARTEQTYPPKEKTCAKEDVNRRPYGVG